MLHAIDLLFYLFFVILMGLVLICSNINVKYRKDIKRRKLAIICAISIFLIGFITVFILYLNSFDMSKILICDTVVPGIDKTVWYYGWGWCLKKSLLGTQPVNYYGNMNFSLSSVIFFILILFIHFDFLFLIISIFKKQK